MIGLGRTWLAGGWILLFFYLLWRGEEEKGEKGRKEGKAERLFEGKKRCSNINGVRDSISICVCGEIYIFR